LLSGTFGNFWRCFRELSGLFSGTFGGELAVLSGTFGGELAVLSGDLNPAKVNFFAFFGDFWRCFRDFFRELLAVKLAVLSGTFGGEIGGDFWIFGDLGVTGPFVW
jgi:hypothetical protein